jgi:hypothetical protein
MPRLALGPWRPDAAALDSDYLSDVRNALLTPSGWISDKTLSPVIDAVLASPIQGLWTVRRTDGTLELFAAAAGHIYRIPGKATAIQDVSDVSGYSTSTFDRWRVAQYGSQLIATDWTDPVQVYDLAAGGDFGDLGGTPPRAKYIAVVRDLVTLGYTHDAIDLDDAYQVRWHGYVAGLPDPTSWTRDVETMADSQRLADVGQIQGLTGGEFGTAVCESGVVRYTFVGSPLVFQFDTVERKLGTRVPESVAQYRQLTFFWSPSGWMAFDGSSVKPIGVAKVDDWFANDLDEGSSHLMWSGVDLARQHVMWLYPGKGNAGACNRLIRYSLPLDEWMVSDCAADCLGGGRTFGLDLDDLTQFPDLDDPNNQINLDDPALWSSLPQSLAVSGGRISSFGGGALPGSWTLSEKTADTENGRRAVLQRLAVVGDGGVSTVAVGRRDRWDGGLSWDNPAGVQSDGTIRLRAAGRSHVLKVAASGDWRSRLALDATASALGLR